MVILLWSTFSSALFLVSCGVIIHKHNEVCVYENIFYINEAYELYLLTRILVQIAPFLC